MGEISLQINIGNNDNPDWQTAWLSSGASVTIECVNPIFDTSAGGSFSYEFDLNCKMNRHIVGNVGTIRGESPFNKLYGKKFKLAFDGVPVAFGTVWVDNQAEIKDDEIAIILKGNNKEWSSLVDGKGLQDLTLLDKNGKRISVGACLPASDTGLNISYTFKGKIFSKYSGNPNDYANKEDYIKYLQSYFKNRSNPFNETSYYTEMSGDMDLDKITLPRVLFNTKLNVDKPFDPTTWENAFCHIRTCMQLYKPKDDGWEKYRGYSVHEPSFNNSAPCFYVSYILRLIINTLGLCIKENSLDTVPDFNRIAIVHTNAAYDWQDGEGTAIKPLNTEDYFDVESYNVDGNAILQLNAKIDTYSDPGLRITLVPLSNDLYEKNEQGIITGYHQKKANYTLNKTGASLVYEAYASNKNLPDITFQDFIDGILNGFGARLLYDSELGTVSIVLLKDILRQEEYQIIPGTVTDLYFKQPNIRGFRLKYSSSTSHKSNPITQKITYTSGSEDTTYNYYDYRRDVVFNSPDNNFGYKELITKIDDSNRNLYIDQLTGNAYRIKVDKDAGKQEEWYPSLFEVGGYRDVAVGDCSDSDTTEEVTIGFAPLISNDVNFKEMYDAATMSSATALLGERKDVSPKYAMFLDKEVHAQEGSDISEPSKFYTHTCSYEDLSFGETEIIEGIKSPILRADCNVLIQSAFSYDYASEEPFHDGDCDFVLAVLRGSGSDARRETVEYDYDGEGNNSWTQVPGSDNECTADNVDALGNLYDYNGTGEGLGYSQSLSLKLKAEKPYKGGRKVYSDASKKEYLEEDFLSETRHACDDNGTPLYDKDGFAIMEPSYYPIDDKLAKRGIFDLFYTDYAYFTLHKKIAVMSVRMSIAELARIDITKKVKIGDVVGWIKKYSYTLDSGTGLSVVTFEIYFL